MKIDDEDTPSAGERKPLCICAALIRSGLPTTTIPELGVTFGGVEAQARIPLCVSDPEAEETLNTARSRMVRQAHVTPPRLPGDVLAKLRLLAGPMGLESGSSGDHATSIRQILAFVEGPPSAG